MTTLASPYCTVDELLVEDGAMTISAKFDKQKFVNVAADEINGKLGYLYKLPLTPDPSITDDEGVALTAIPAYQANLIKTVNVKMASGRIFMTLKGSGDSDRQHQWGWQLCQEAEDLLNKLANGEILIDALPKPDGSTGVPESTRGMTIVNEDSTSMRAAFENTVFRNRPTQTFPGADF